MWLQHDHDHYTMPFWTEDRICFKLRNIKTWRKVIGQSRMDNPGIQATLNTRHKTKTN